MCLRAMQLLRHCSSGIAVVLPRLRFTLGLFTSSHVRMRASLILRSYAAADCVQMPTVLCRWHSHTLHHHDCCMLAERLDRILAAELLQGAGLNFKLRLRL
jgi:hypothetical protein